MFTRRCYTGVVAHVSFELALCICCLFKGCIALVPVMEFAINLVIAMLVYMRLGKSVFIVSNTVTVCAYGCFWLQWCFLC